MPLLGAHVSAAGGVSRAIENARALSIEAMQIFGSSPRQWSVVMPSAAELTKYHEALAHEKSPRSVFLHAPYLINLASPDPLSREKSIGALVGNIQIADLLKAQGVVFHMGSSKGSGREAGIEATVAGMREVLTRTPGNVDLVMENSSGGGDKLGNSIAELGNIMRKVDSPRVKLCLDTAHAFEAGVIEHYSPEEITELLDTIESECGSVQKLVALHINDSKTPYKSNTDRHENIGNGYIGRAAFENLAHEKRLSHTTWILEVPGLDGEGPDKHNVDIVRECLHTKN